MSYGAQTALILLPAATGNEEVEGWGAGDY